MKLFLSIGKHLAETIISLRQSKQITECELAARNVQTPTPHYQEPYQLFQPSNPDLHPHTESKMTAIALTVSVFSPCDSKAGRPQKQQEPTSTAKMNHERSH